MKFDKLHHIANAIANSGALQAIDHALDGETGTGWINYLGQLREVIETNKPRFKVFAKDGNSKLPFLSFSSLAGEAFCAGAGECLKFCYSFKAWRYPAAFGRQAQNAWLLQSAEGREAILAALDEFKPADGETIDFRLYVDGDFSSVDDVAFWMAALAERPWLRAYGYSKSWAELLTYDAQGKPWAANYMLNLSSGSRHSAAVEERVAQLPITRGRFVAVNVGRKVKASDHGDREHQRELRQTYGKKAFTCTGLCGSCTKGGHACGSEKFKDVDIIIAVH